MQRLSGARLIVTTTPLTQATDKCRKPGCVEDIVVDRYYCLERKTGFTRQFCLYDVLLLTEYRLVNMTTLQCDHEAWKEFCNLIFLGS